MSNIFISKSRFSEKKKDFRVRFLGPSIGQSITFYLYVVVAFVFFVQWLRYRNAERSQEISFSNQNLIFAIIMAISSILFLFGVVRYQSYQDFEKEDGWIQYFGNTGLLFVGIAVSNFLIAAFITPEKLQITPAEYYIFYFSTACAEEFFFRGLILTASRYLFNAFEIPRFGIEFLAITISSLVFGFMHLWVYSGNVGMLVSVFVGGFLLGFFYVFSDNILVPITGHAFLNLIVTGSQIQTLLIITGKVGETQSIQLTWILIAVIIVYVFSLIIIYQTRDERDVIEANEHRDE